MGLDKIYLLKLFISGGPMMWPILLCSVLALAVVIEKFIYLKKAKIDTEEFLNNLMEKMKRHETKEALEICDKTDSPIANILKAGILKYDRPRAQIIEAIEDASLYEIPRIEKNLPILATIAHISPLLGLLGTVMGLARCFQAIQARAQGSYPVLSADMAGGVWEALLVTIAGLLVAIPVYITYNYLVSRINRYILEMERTSVELVNFLTE